MKTASILFALLALGITAPVFAQDSRVEVTPVVEGRAEPGKDWTLKLRISVPEGFHAYHKDNPGGSVPVGVTFKELSGLVETEQTWPEPKKHKTEYTEEWKLVGTFDIAWKFKVPAEARGKLVIAGAYDIQFCDADACYQADGEFNTSVEVAGTQPEPDLTARAAFEGEAQPGGKAVMAVTFTVRKGWHAYHKDNPASATGIPLKVTLDSGALKLASQVWPEPHKIDRWNIGSVDWELEGTFVVRYTFDVPADAAGDIKVSGKFDGQVCDEVCVEVKGDFGATLTVAHATVPKPANDTKDKHGFYLDFDFALAESRRLSKPLLVDFNGKFCPPCRAMETTVFPLPEVHKLFDDYVRVSIITDVKDPKADELWKKHRPSKSAGVPYYAVMDAAGEKVVRGISSTLPAEERSHQFVAFLKGRPIPEPRKADKPDTTPAKDAPAGWPQGLPGPKPADMGSVFDFESVFTGARVQPGGEVSLELRFRLKADPKFGPYRMYHPKSPHSEGMSLFELITVETGGLEPLGEWRYPKPKVMAGDDPANEFKPHEQWKYFGNFTLVRKFRVPKDAKDGATFRVTGTLAGQYCHEQLCFWFADMDQNPFGWVASVTAAADGALSAVAEPVHGDSKGAVAQPEPKSGLAADIEKSGGLLWFLLGVFGLGMITLLTPCVLPVLPLTVAFFVKQAEQGRSPLAAAGIYCGCIVGSFTLFGLVTSLALGEQGAQIIATDPWVNIAIGVLFTVFALSFFGLFELRMPTFLSSWISRNQMHAQKQGKGYLTALLSGGSFAVISFSCTGPIAASLLTGVATGLGGDESGGRWIPTLAMAVYASGLALPIFVLGQFPSLLRRLPKSGGWMNALKVVFAFIEIAIAIRYFSWAEIAFTEEPVPQWINRDIVDAFWVACSAAAGLYLLGLFRMPHDHEKAEQVGVIRMLIAISFLAFAIYLLPGLTSGKPMGLLDGFMPPRAASGSHGGGGNAHSLEWHRDLDAGLAEAKKTGKPVFIDFTGVVCSNCRWVETNIMPKPEVLPMLQDEFVRVQQWTDIKSDTKAKENYKKYGQGQKGVPFYVIVDADGNMLEKFVPSTFINGLTPTEFAEFMRKGKQKLFSGG